MIFVNLLKTDMQRAYLSLLRNKSNLGFVFQNEKKYREALACYLLARDIRTQIKDPYLEQTESNLKNLKEELGKKKFEKLAAEVAPRAEEIVGELLK